VELGYTIFFVPDVVKAIEFYEKAFNLERGFLHEGKDYGEMKTGQTKLCFTSWDLIKSEKIPFAEHSIKDVPISMEIALVTKDVKKAFAQAVSHGATPVIEPKQTPWGQEVAYVRDLNGFLIDLCSPMG